MESVIEDGPYELERFWSLLGLTDEHLNIEARQEVGFLVHDHLDDKGKWLEPIVPAALYSVGNNHPARLKDAEEMFVGLIHILDACTPLP